MKTKRKTKKANSLILFDVFFSVFFSFYLPSTNLVSCPTFSFYSITRQSLGPMNVCSILVSMLLDRMLFFGFEEVWSRWWWCWRPMNAWSCDAVSITIGIMGINNNNKRTVVMSSVVDDDGLKKTKAEQKSGKQLSPTPHTLDSTTK